ncbi:hypothetical protein P154DRAFT_457646, partial [Amniculicola lignicola CBS 123094]
MRPAFRHAGKLVGYEPGVLGASIPAFLCPALLRGPSVRPVQHTTSLPPRTFSTFRRNRQQATTPFENSLSHDGLPLNNHQPPPPPPPQQTLPRSCPGCGAPTQLYERGAAGYYDIDRRQIKNFLTFDPNEQKEKTQEEHVYNTALQKLDSSLLEELGVDTAVLNAPPEVVVAAPETPVCDRCHNLINHHIGVPISHPSVDAIKETIAESPHRRNHIYHVIDAADFPLSLIPNLQTALRLPKLRTQNRRAKHKGWVANNRIAEVSFVITRADLLAPLKEQVDGLLPYMQGVLRDALGRVNRDARLGNVYLVSAKRGWWTKKVKEDIWERGGAGWMVGKVNVGKSNLFEMVFPKGRGADYEDIRRIRTAEEKKAMLASAKSLEELTRIQRELDDEDESQSVKSLGRKHPSSLAPLEHPEPNEKLEEDDEDYDPDSLLPPAQPYTPFPVLPLASSLPGTTASPIRIPYGRDRGELVDLPGLARTTPELQTFVKPEHHSDLIMTHRIAAERHILKAGKSLILGGGLIRITPVNQDLVFLVHPFVPIPPHITSTEKAIGMQDQTRESGVETLLLPNVGAQMRSAGTFKLQWDATKKLAGPLTNAVAGKMKPENLPFRIWSADLLIEGLGWVEVSCQMRRPQGWMPVGLVKKDPNHARKEKMRLQEERRGRIDDRYAATLDARVAAGAKDGMVGDAFDRAGLGGGSNTYPEIQVFSPLGKYIGIRPPMCGSVLGGPKQVSSRERKGRPRRSMVSVKAQRRSGKG